METAMNNLEIKATRYTPGVFFDAQNHLLEIRGESYPEDVTEFYDPVFSWLEHYLRGLENQRVTMNISLIYFNSSSSKVLMDLFDMLEEAAEKQNDISVNWIYDKEDVHIEECGKEFQEDFEVLRFNLVQAAG